MQLNLIVTDTVGQKKIVYLLLSQTSFKYIYTDTFKQEKILP